MELEVIGDSETDVIESIGAYAKFNGIKIDGEIGVHMLEPKRYFAKFETVKLKKYAVCCTDYDELVKIELHEAETWKDALYMHSYIIKEWDEGCLDLPDELESAKEAAVDVCGFEFDVKEI